MPQDTLTPNDQSISTELLPPRLPALGYIKIGMQRPGTEGGRGKSPMKIDHFRVTTRVREKVDGNDGNFLLDEDVHRELGAKPTMLDIRLPFDTRAQNFYSQMVQYDGRTKAQQCDGNQVTNLRTGKSSVCTRKQGTACNCKPYGRLGVMLEASPTFGGLHVFRTTSWESVASIRTALDMFEEQFGSLRGLPLRMRLYPAEVQFTANGKEMTSTAYKVAVELRASFAEAQQEALEFHRANQIARREILQIGSATSEELAALDVADARSIGDEFFPGVSGADDSDTPPRGLSRVADLNRRLASGEVSTASSGDDPEPSSDLAATEPEPEPEPTPEPDPVPEELREPIEKLLGFLKKAKGAGIVSADQVARIEQAVDNRDATNIRISIDWLRTQLAAHEQQQGD